MLVLFKGNEYNVTDKFTLAQMLKYGAVKIEDKSNKIDIKFEEPKTTEALSVQSKKRARKKN